MDNMVGIRIHERRNELNLTPKAVKELTGIGSGHLSELENGKKLPSTPTLIKLAELFNCSTDWILFGTTSKYESTKNTLSARECEMIDNFSCLDPDDQDEILAMINLKIQRKEKRRKSLNLEADQATIIA